MSETPDRDQLREDAEAHLRYGGGGDDLANGVLALLDQLEQAEARATRAEAKAEMRKRQIAYWREEAQRVRDRLRALEGGG